MSILIVEPVDPDVMAWLAQRHALQVAPDLAHDPAGFRAALAEAQAALLPPSVALDARALRPARRLKAVGRVSAGAENIDLDACARAGVEVVRHPEASAQAEAEFLIGALLAMLRRVPVFTHDGLLVGRELRGATVGVIGLGLAAPLLAGMLRAFGARVVGYDPAVHASDPRWAQSQIDAVGLLPLMQHCDAVCVMLAYFSRYEGLLGERYLSLCKPHQVLASISHSSLFDEAALAQVLGRGRMAAAWLDSLEPGAIDAGRPLHGVATLQVTPHVASTTRESRLRSAWGVARRIDQILGAPAAPVAATRPGGATDPALGPASA
jgi:phosphoglycerate dehydrogenase-like enzyme